MLRLLFVALFTTLLSTDSEVRAKSSQAPELSTLLLEEIVECMAYFNIRHNIKQRKNDYGSAQESLMYHQQLTMLATGLAQETQSIVRLPGLNHTMIEKLLGEMENRYSQFHKIDQKYRKTCLDLFTNFDERRKHWLSQAVSPTN